MGGGSKQGGNRHIGVGRVGSTPLESTSDPPVIFIQFSDWFHALSGDVNYFIASITVLYIIMDFWLLSLVYGW